MAGISKLDAFPVKEGIVLASKEKPRVPLAQSSNFWPLTARLYEPLWRNRSLSILTQGNFTVKRELDLMLEWLNPQAHERILDAACSAGLYARALLKHDPSLNLSAVDFSLPFLKQAQSYAKRDDIKLELIQADVTDLPFENESFDALVCGGSLNEFLDVPKTLSEFSRVLKSGGRMWQMYLRRADGLMGKSIQGLLRLSGIRFIDTRELEHVAHSVNLKLIKAQHRGIVVMALFQKL